MYSWIVKLKSSVENTLCSQFFSALKCNSDLITPSLKTILINTIFSNILGHFNKIYLNDSLLKDSSLVIRIFAKAKGSSFTLGFDSN